MRGWGTGPVFAYEFLTASRRWQVYALRSLFVSALLVGLVVVWQSQSHQGPNPTIRQQAEVGESYFYAIIGIQLALVLLAAPAATAGAICLDKARGTLAHMLVTDLTDPEIVLGKLAARLLPVVGLVAATLPVMSLGTLLGGIDPEAMGLAFLVTLTVAVVGCTLALTISVWATKTHEVLMATYALWTLGLLLDLLWKAFSMTAAFGLPSPPNWVRLVNPFYVAFAPYVSPGALGWPEYVGFFGVALAVSAALALVSVWRLRAVMIRQAGGARPGRRVRTHPGPIARLQRWLPGPTLDGNPVLWREWHRNRPSRLTRLIGWGFALGVSAGGVWGVYGLIRNGVGPGGPEVGVLIAVLQSFLGLLLLSVTAATSLAEERTRGSLDVLLATPLSTRSILWGKWWGTFRFVPLLAFWPGVIVAAMAFTWRRPLPAGWGPNFYKPLSVPVRVYAVALLVATILAHGALITSLGLALATWVHRQGRAVGLVVAAYVLVSIGWVFLIMILFSRGPHQTAEGLAMLSAFFCVGSLTEGLTFGGNRIWMVGWATFWLVVVSSVAAVLLVATWRTFDRCLGRITDWVGEWGLGFPDTPKSPKVWTPRPGWIERPEVAAEEAFPG